MPPKEHAYLTPSGANRWMHCPASPYLESYFPETEEKPYSTEGSLAHKYAEQRLTKELLGEPVDLEPVKQEIRDFYQNHPSDENLEDVERYIEEYIEFIKNQISLDPPTYPLMERQLNLGEFIPEGFGTSDVVLIQSGCIHIIDLKYGRGVLVPTKHNPQLMIYALGAATTIGDFLSPDKLTTIKMSIVQPRRGKKETWEIPYSELLDWAENVLKPAAENAISNTTEFHAGEWCDFCRAAGHCKHRSTKLIQGIQYLQEHTMTGTDQQYILDHADEWIKTIHTIQASALDDLEKGKVIPGYKAVRKNTHRSFDSKDSDALLAIAQEHGMNIQKTTILSPAQVEKKCKNPKEFQALFGTYVRKKQGGPTLAREDDPRPAILPVDIEPMSDLIFSSILHFEDTQKNKASEKPDNPIVPSSHKNSA